MFYLPSRESDQAVSWVKPSFPWVTLFSLYTKIGFTSGICFLQVSRVQMDCVLYNFRKNKHRKTKSQQEKMLPVFLPNTCIVYQSLVETTADLITIPYCATGQGAQVSSILVTYISKPFLLDNSLFGNAQNTDLFCSDTSPRKWALLAAA